MRSGASIAVVGSLNMDLVVRTARLPQPGETVRGHDFQTAPGGKGANQAVAAARLARPPVTVALIGCVGDDAFGAALRGSVGAAGVATKAIRTVPGATGVALIGVEAGGQNSIIIAPGANAALSPADIEAEAATLRGAGTLLLQLESPLATVTRAAGIAAGAGARVILNPAPALNGSLPTDLLRYVNILVPNETEAAALTGAGAPRAAAEALRGWGIPTVIVTLGEQGALVATEEGIEQIPSFAISPVDTTAAGDAFVGALAVALAEGQPLAAAVRFASGAGALAATRPGAQPSLPIRADLDRFLAAS